MVKVVTQSDQTLYQCEVCNFHYKLRAKAEECEVWCAEHKSCHLGIISHAEENK